MCDGQICKSALLTTRSPPVLSGCRSGSPTAARLLAGASVTVSGLRAKPDLRTVPSSPSRLPDDLGMRVQVSGLRAKPELNGRVGTVISYDAAKEVSAAGAQPAPLAPPES